MNVEKTYISSNGTFEVRASNSPIDFSPFQNSTNNDLYKLYAIETAGHLYDAKSHPVTSAPLIQSTTVVDCPNNWTCLEANLVRQSSSWILGLNDTFGHDFITIYHLPFYHIRVINWVPPTPLPISLKGDHCRWYGCGDQIGALICASTTKTDKGTMLTVGTAPQTLYSQLANGQFDDLYPNNARPSGQIPLHPHFVHGRAAHIQVEQRYADFTYRLDSKSAPISIENEIEDHSPVEVDAEGYLSVFDTIYPAPFNHTGEDSLGCYLLIGAETLLKQKYGLEVHLLPIIVQQTLAKQDEAPLPNASFRNQSYRVTATTGATEIFTCTTIAILLWCLILMVMSKVGRIPEVSAYTEIDMLGKLPIQDVRGTQGCGVSGIQSRIYENGRNVVKAMRGVILAIKEDKNGGLGDQELGNMGRAAAPD